MADTEYGALAAALAKAQASFPTVPRDKSVTVQTKTGGSYTFKYAPLDSILAAVRGPLAANGLAISQLMDDDELVTMLLHESGARLIGRTPIPQAEGIQALGSAVTYLRRYSIQALLGIAAEEDDDGNRAAGNSFRERDLRAEMAAKASEPDGLIGTAIKQDKITTDFHVRQSPEGPFLGFRLKNGDGAGVICEVRGDMAEALAAIEPDVLDQRVQVWGSFVQYDPPTVKHSYRALRVSRIQTPSFILPSTVEASGGAPSETEVAGSGRGSDPAALDAEIDSLPMFTTNTETGMGYPE